MSITELTSDQEFDLDRITFELKNEGIGMKDWQLIAIDEIGRARKYIFSHQNGEDDLHVIVDDYVVFDITGSVISKGQPSIKNLIRTIAKTTFDICKDERKFDAILIRNYSIYWDVLNEMDIQLSLIDHFEPKKYESKEKLAEYFSEVSEEYTTDHGFASILDDYIENWWWVKGMHLALDYIVKEGIDMTGWVNTGDKCDLSRGEYRFYNPITEESFSIDCSEENGYVPTPLYLEESYIDIPYMREAKSIREAIELNLKYRDNPIGREIMIRGSVTSEQQNMINTFRYAQEYLRIRTREMREIIYGEASPELKRLAERTNDKLYKEQDEIRELEKKYRERNR